MKDVAIVFWSGTGNTEKMAELGFMGINVPEEYGGAGMDEVSKALVIMEIAKVDASVAELLAVHTLTNGDMTSASSIFSF